MVKIQKTKVVDVLKDVLDGHDAFSSGALIAIVNKLDLINNLKAAPSVLPDEKSFAALKSLLIKIKEMEDEPKQRIAVLTAIPHKECEQECCFLDERRDFFIPYLVDVFKEDYDGELCEKLMKHLNDCFRCMTRFSEEMRDYHRQYSKFKQG